MRRKAFDVCFGTDSLVLMPAGVREIPARLAFSTALATAATTCSHSSWGASRDS